MVFTTTTTTNNLLPEIQALGAGDIKLKQDGAIVCSALNVLENLFETS